MVAGPGTQLISLPCCNDCVSSPQIVTITGKDLGNGLEWPQLVYMRVNFFNDCVSNATTSTLAVPTLASPCSGKGAQQVCSLPLLVRECMLAQ